MRHRATWLPTLTAPMMTALRVLMSLCICSPIYVAPRAVCPKKGALAGRPHSNVLWTFCARQMTVALRGGTVSGQLGRPGDKEPDEFIVSAMPEASILYGESFSYT